MARAPDEGPRQHENRTSGARGLARIFHGNSHETRQFLWTRPEYEVRNEHRKGKVVAITRTRADAGIGRQQPSCWTPGEAAVVMGRRREREDCRRRHEKAITSAGGQAAHRVMTW